MKTSITPKRLIIFIVSIAVMFIGSSLAFTPAGDFIFGNLQASLDIFSSSPPPTASPRMLQEAVIETDRLDYSPGEIVEISGDGFLPNETVRLQVNYKPLPMVRSGASEVASGHLPWDITADFAGRVSAQWLVEEDSLNQRLQLTADGLQSGYHAEAIFTDAQGGGIGADKAVYKLDQGIWTTGNAGATTEGQWVPYQYVLTNIDPNEPLPNFRITYPLFIDGNDAMYFDGVSNLRYCIDTGDGVCDDQGGSTPGSLPDGTARPPTSITRWIPFQVTTVNAPYPPGSCVDPADPIPGGVVGVSAPCELRYFQITPGTNSVPANIGAASRITFFFEFHLAQTPLWINGLEANFEQFEANAIPTHPNARPLNVTYGFNIYNTWTNDFFGAGIASIGSSQHVNFQDAVANGPQGVPSGAITLPVPTVDITSDSTVSGVKFEDLDGDGIKDAGEPGLPGWTITLSGNLLGGTPVSFPTVTAADGSYSFPQIFPGTYTIVETSQVGYVQTAPNNTPAGQLPNGSPNPSGVTHTGGTYNLSIPDGTAGLFANLDFGNQRPFGHIIVDKVTLPGGDTTSFSFDAGGGSYMDFSLTDAAAPNDQQLVAGNYSVAETVPAGWVLTSATCSDGSPIAAISLQAGETITCTFTNTKDATVTVTKDAQPNDAQDFGFTTTGSGPAGWASFMLDDDGEPTLSNTVTFTFPAAQQGAKTVVEGATSGWSLTNLTCSEGSVNIATRTASFTVDPGDAITCTYTNTKDATVTVTKDAQPNDAQDFGFTTTGSGPAGWASFMLDDDGEPTLSNTVTFTFPAAQQGAKTVVEGATSGWSLTNLTCSEGSVNIATRTASFTVDPGDAITCTYTNTKDATVTVTKDAQPNDAQDFGFTTTGSGPAGWASFMLDDDGEPTLSNTVTFTFPAAQQGAKTVVEGATSGWSLTNLTCSEGSVNIATRTASFTVDPGDAITCTYTNTKDATVTVTKDAQPNDAQDFGFTTTGSGPAGWASFMLDDDGEPTLSNTVTFTFPAAQQGAKTVVEGAVSGWSLTNLTCSEGSVNIATRTASFTVDPGDAITCTYTNVKDATVTVTKDAQPNNAQDFGFTTTGSGPAGWASFMLDDDGEPTLSNTVTFTFPGSQQGAKTVVEGATSGWSLTNLTCSEGSVNIATRTASFTVDPGDAITCTYTNVKDATVTVTKDAQPNDAQDFAFTTTGSGPAGWASFMLDDDGEPTLSNTVTFTFPAAQQGAKTVVEGATSGWSLTNLTCSEGSVNIATRTASFTVDPGDAITCTYTNTKDATVTVTKDAQPNDAQDFGFTTTGSGPAGWASFMLDDDGEPTLSNTVTFTFPAAQQGAKTVVEGAVSGWDLTNLTCSEGSVNIATRTASFTVDPGDAVTCTYTNTKRGKIIVEKQTNPSGSTQQFEFDSNYGPNFFLVDNGTNDSGLLQPGTYSVAELVPTGWDVDNVACSDGSPRDNIALGAGETVTCVFTNTQRGKIIVEKQTNPSGSTQQFEFDSNYGPNFFLVDNGTNDSGFLVAGTYSVAELVPTGWDVDNVNCSDGSPRDNIALGAGETVTCVFTNTQRGAIKIVKNTVGGDGTFEFNPTGFNANAPFSLITSGGMQMRTFNNLPAGGTYSITETPQTGWDLISFTCDHASSPASITVAVGETTTCTATNRKRGSIKIIKDALPDAAQDFVFDASGLNGDLDFTLDDDNDNTNSNMITFNNVVPGGSYSVVENVTPLWQLAGISCQSSNGVDNNTISVANRSVVFSLEAGEAITCTFRNINVVGFVTSSSLCTFDVDPVKDGSQFRLLFTPDNSASVYKQNASNPGQYYYNVLHYSDPTNPNDNVVTMNIPFPFVTHGATPIHVYSDVTTTQVDGQTCLAPGGELSNQQDQITFESYTNPVLGVTTTSVDVDVPDGFSYVNIHLDYGLKHTTGYLKSVVGDMNNADQTIDEGPFRPDIPDCQPYTFSNGGVHVVQSINSFKKNPGVGGSNRTLFEEPITGQTLILKTAGGVVVGRPGISDEDGWYFISYKHTGKPALYTVTWLETGQVKTVTLKANGMAEADFTNSP